ncbi:MAG TPA: hypothetical protein VEO00_07005 [Actinomycetota bacterium]|nr:hypothetical protein [Actinomycetota bacterium]
MSEIEIAADLFENEHTWDQVDRLAAELPERKTMSGRAARETLLASLDGRFPVTRS